MQISDLVGQYNQASASGAEKLTGTKGVENLESVVNVGFLHRIRLLDWVIISLYG